MDFAVQRAITKYNIFPCRFPMFGGFTSRKKRASSAIPGNVDVWSDIRPSWVIAVIAKTKSVPLQNLAASRQLLHQKISKECGLQVLKKEHKYIIRRYAGTNVSWFIR